MRNLCLLLCVSLFVYSLADHCSTIPNSLWCLNGDVEKECGFKEHCDRYRTATRNQPILLTILIEALCPDCQKWIMDTLYPKVYKNFAGFVNIEFVPYGNAKIENGTVVCQHGEEECQINKFESCLIDTVQSQDRYVPLIYCIESELKAGVTFDKVAAKCFRTQGVDPGEQRMIQSCLVSRLGTRLQEKAAARTADVWPEKHQGVPWIIFNNISLGSAQSMMNDLPATICQWYNGDKPIPYCTSQEKKLYKQRSRKN